MMTQSDYLAIKDTVRETKKLAEEMEITFSEALAVRQVNSLEWLCHALANSDRIKPNSNA